MNSARKMKVEVSSVEAMSNGRSAVVHALVSRYPGCIARDIWRAVRPHWRCSETEIRRRVRALEECGRIVAVRSHGGRALLFSLGRGGLRPYLAAYGWCYLDVEDGYSVWWPSERAETLADLCRSYATGDGRWST
jgi:hypothetical protein